MHEHHERSGGIGRIEGLRVALVGVLLLVGAFSGFTAATPLAPAERWAALTTITILAFAVTLLGCGAIADAVGRSVRRDWRAFAALLSVIPVLASAYAAAVGRFTRDDLLSAALLVAVPALALWFSRTARQPTALDGVGLGYLWLVSTLNLWPALPLPVVGARVAFFTLALIPLVVVLLAARGWPGLGFTWNLSGADLWAIPLGALIGLALALPGRFVEPIAFAAGGALPTFGRAIEAYFFVALPIALLDRGIVQQGVTRMLAGSGWAPVIGIGVGALAGGVRVAVQAPGNWAAAGGAALAAIGYGWVYWRTGKVTAAAVSQVLVGLAGAEAMG